MRKPKPTARKKTKQSMPLTTDILTLANRGNSFLAQGKLKEAIESYQKVLSLKPDFAEVYNNLGVALQQQRNFALAINYHQKALSFKPDYAQAYLNLGMAFNDLGKFEVAIENYRQTLLLNPNYADAYCNLGLALKNQGNFDEAIASYYQALALDANLVEARFNLGFLLLSLGKFEEGWLYYESRPNLTNKHSLMLQTRFSFPQWQGESITGKSLLVWSEQGFGDEIQFCRYVAVLKKNYGASHITWVCKKPLKALLQTLTAVDTVLTEEETAVIAPHDYWTFALNIPLHCKTTLKNIPAEIPYLYADPLRVENMALELSKIKEFKIGLCWKGSPTFRGDLQRSPGIAPFKPLFKLAGVKFFTLQPQTRTEFMAVAGKAGGDIGREIDGTTFADAAALMVNLDLIISSDTSICHLAGALGKPVWIVLPFVADWRWLIEREDSPWYPNARLFRQTTPGDWDGVFVRVETELKKLVTQLD